MAEKPVSTESQLTEEIGDLFSCPVSASLAHCVSRDLHMDKGIAVLFKKKFGGVTALRDQNKDLGECAVLEDNSRFIFYLITKEKYFHKPKLATLKQAVCDMKKHCVAKGVGELCLPKIGCGLDRLDWMEVKQVLVDTFKDTNVKLYVYSLN